MAVDILTAFVRKFVVNGIFKYSSKNISLFAETNNFMAPGGLNLDIHGHTSSRGEKALNDSPTVMGSQRSPRRRLTQRHTVAMVDRDGNMVRWVENDPAIRFVPICHYFVINNALRLSRKIGIYKVYPNGIHGSIRKPYEELITSLRI